MEEKERESHSRQGRSEEVYIAVVEQLVLFSPELQFEILSCKLTLKWKFEVVLFL